MERIDWEETLRRTVKGELALRARTYKHLARDLESVGINESAETIANLISRGKFPAWKLLAWMSAIGTKRLELVEPVIRK